MQDVDLLRTLNGSDQANIRQILTLLDAAIKLCADRKEQIAPLVKALTPAKDTPDSA